MWALSPRLRKNFNSSFDFEFLGGTRTMPISDRSREAVTASLLRLANIEEDDLIKTAIKRHMDHLTTQMRPYRHAECTLIHHLTDLKGMNIGMNFCSYIGVSKLSCFGCSKWIHSFNSCHNTRWATSGTHGKFYSLGYFETQEEITEDMLRTIKKAHSELKEEFVTRCRAKWGEGMDPNSAISDSSNDDISANFHVTRLPLSESRQYLESLRGQQSPQPWNRLVVPSLFGLRLVMDCRIWPGLVTMISACHRAS